MNLVEAFNAYADAGTRPMPMRSRQARSRRNRTPRPTSSSASGIEQRYVMNKSGVLDPDVMHPWLRARSDDEPGIMAEMALDACGKALAMAGRGGTRG
jgi:beta-ketodecanoyl-[acyl-carrier-protein] synthase